MTCQKILLIRHGQTDWNAQRRWQGALHEIALNAQGQAQACLLGEYLTGCAVEAIYSSDLQRAWETAAIIGQTLGLTPIPDTRLREVHAGVFQGLTWPELETKYPEHTNDYLANSRQQDYRFPEGESWREVSIRAYEALKAVTEITAYKTTVLVTHGGTLRRLLVHLFPELRDAELHFPNTSISIIEHSEAGWKLIELGKTPHLL